jgi:hypothetical protein
MNRLCLCLNTLFQHGENQTEPQQDLVQGIRIGSTVNHIRLLKNPIVRWTIAILYLAVSLFLLIAAGDLPRIDQIVVTVTCVIGFFVLPIALKGYVESAPERY